jgi:hypothetical protein
VTQTWSLADCAQTPADSEVYVDGEVRRGFAGIDVEIGELIVARPVYRTYYEHGIDRILAMHIDDRDLRELEKGLRLTANLVISGHMASGSIGMNRVLDAIEHRGVEVIAGSGVIRV